MRDAKRIAKRLNISKKVFLDTYTLLDEDGDLVINASPCPFLLEDNKCRIYEDRPAACRLYPHSGEELFYKNLSHHKRNARYCPGLLEILKRIAQQH
jgi:Fe-S-cluster containining protein